MSETLAEKKELSSRVLLKGIYLLEQINKVVEHPQCPTLIPQLRDKLVLYHRVVSKFCQHFDLCDRPFNCPYDMADKLQCVIVADEMLHLMRVIKRSLAVMGQMQNPNAQDSIFKIFSKLNTKIQNYFVRIDYWREENNAAGFFY